MGAVSKEAKQRVKEGISAWHKKKWRDDPRYRIKRNITILNYSARQKGHSEFTTRPEDIPDPADSCEICESTKKLCMDHCHTYGHFRGWICWDCNVALGLVKDSPERLDKLKVFLLTHGPVETTNQRVAV